MNGRRRATRVLPLLLSGLLLVGTSPAGTSGSAPSVDAELAAALQLRLDRWRINHRAPGAAAAVRLPDGSQWIGVSGKRTTGKGAKRIKAWTPFAVASLTKTFMAALLLQLQEEGRISLDWKIKRWLPDYPKAGRITVEMLLNHTSGIHDYFASPSYERLVFGRPKHRWRTREILALVGPRYCRPGACYRYSNTNYVLLATIVKQVTGRHAASEIRRRFLEPLGLTDTFYQGKEAIGLEPARGYLATAGGWQGFWDGTRLRPHTSGATVAHAAGALLSSVRDISDWQDSLFGGDVLSPESLALMLDFHSGGYGLGMREARLDGRPGVGHGGSLRGFMALMYRLPEEEIDVVVMTSLGRTTPEGLVDKLTRATLNHLALQP